MRSCRSCPPRPPILRILCQFDASIARMEGCLSLVTALCDGETPNSVNQCQTVLFTPAGSCQCRPLTRVSIKCSLRGIDAVFICGSLLQASITLQPDSLTLSFALGRGNLGKRYHSWSCTDLRCATKLGTLQPLNTCAHKLMLCSPLLSDPIDRHLRSQSGIAICPC